MRSSVFRACALIVASGTAAGCSKAEDDAVVVGGPAPQDSALASAVPVDRLTPGELAPGTLRVNGLLLPREMRLDRSFEGVSHVVGDVRPEDVANYVRKRVTVAHVEIGAGRTVFPRARINGDASGKLYQIDVAAERGRTRLVIRDTTAPPTPQGLSEDERWRRAGFKPDGTPLDPAKLD